MILKLTVIYSLLICSDGVCRSEASVSSRCRLGGLCIRESGHLNAIVSQKPKGALFNSRGCQVHLPMMKPDRTDKLLFKKEAAGKCFLKVTYIV